MAASALNIIVQKKLILRKDIAVGVLDDGCTKIILQLAWSPHKAILFHLKVIKNVLSKN